MTAPKPSECQHESFSPTTSACIRCGKPAIALVARLREELAEARAGLAASQKNYLDLADAVCRESTSVEDACNQARATRDAAYKRGRRVDQLQAERDEARRCMQWEMQARAVCLRERDDLLRQIDETMRVVEAARQIYDGTRDPDGRGLGQTWPVDFEMPPSVNKRVRALLGSALAAYDAARAKEQP
jgi:hypothetical protein